MTALPMLESTMQDVPLTITALMRHGRRVHADARILTCHAPDDITEATFAEVADRADQLAAALRDIGVAPGDRVGTFLWNNQRHMEAYLAIPCMGAVLHTLNIRLFPEQLAYVADHAADKAIIVDGSLAPLLARVIEELPQVETIITCGEGDYEALAAVKQVVDYEELTGLVARNAAAAVCACVVGCCCGAGLVRCNRPRIEPDPYAEKPEAPEY